MNFEQLQQTWQATAGQTAGPAVDTSLLQRVRGDARRFERAIIWRDGREVAASLVVAAAFGRVAWSANAEGSPAWPAWLAAVLPLGVAVFFLADRWWSRRRGAARGEALLTEIDRAIQAVEHQRWLLRNVVWWYLLPLACSVGLVVMQVVLYLPSTLPATVAGVIKVVMTVSTMIPTAALFWWVWRLNQKAVRTELEPRLHELRQRRREIVGED